MGILLRGPRGCGTVTVMGRSIAPRRKSIGGTQFTCVRPGYWLSRCQMLAIVEMMEGRVEHQWVLFRTARGCDHATPRRNIDAPEILNADFWGVCELAIHFTMGELDQDVARALVQS